MKVSTLLDHAHRLLARSRIATATALKVRNQVRCVIKYHLGETPDRSNNGEAWLIRLAATKGSSFVDVGANVGDWTALWLESDPAPSIGLLFDPSETASAALSARFAGVRTLSVLALGVSDEPGQQTFFEEPAAGERSSFVKGTSDLVRPQQRQVTTIDAELSARQVASLDFLKIDVEGYDLHVLRGARGYIAKRAIGFVQFEYNVDWAIAGSTLAAAYELLSGYGYEVFLLRSDGLWRFDYPRYGEFFSYSNFVAVSPDRLDQVRSHVRGMI
jgi:FkbM family methyltransferase